MTSALPVRLGTSLRIVTAVLLARPARLLALAVAFALACAMPASAAAEESPSPPAQTGPLAGAAPPPVADKAAVAQMDTRERRNGLVFGFMGGYGAAGSSGYPNKASQIDAPGYYSAS